VSLLVALAIAIFVGLTVDALVNAGVYVFDLTWPPYLTGFWGVFFGAFATPVAFGLALMFLSRPKGTRRPSVGRWIAAVTLALFGALVLYWISWWGFMPWTLEGAWIYPLGFVPLFAASWVLLRGNPRTRAAGRWLGAATLTLLAAAAFYWISFAGVVPWSLMGLWTYPLALLSLVGAVMLVNPRFRPRRSADLWSQPGPTAQHREITGSDIH
jgi:hypothetical protein